MKKIIYLILTLMFLLPINSMGQQKGTSRNRLISWTQSEDGTLTFVGSGILDGREFTGFSDDFKGYNNRIIISSGITEVRYLHDMYQVEHVSLPNTLKKIGEFAFRGYTELKSITIPASVTEIAPTAFDMGECGGGKLDKIIVDNNNIQFKSIDGILYDHDVRTLICCPSGYDGEVNIPNTVEVIGEMAFFFCTKLKNVKLPENLKVIKEAAFIGANIHSINIPQSVHSIGLYALRGSDEGHLEKITVDDNNTYYKSIDGILYNKEVKTLICCPSCYEGEVNVPNSVVAIEKAAFFSCCKLTNIKLPDYLKFIKDAAFMKSNILSLNIPKSVSYIGKDVFRECEELEQVYIGNKSLNIRNVIPENATISDVPIE